MAPHALRTRGAVQTADTWLRRSMTAVKTSIQVAATVLNRFILANQTVIRTLGVTRRCRSRFRKQSLCRASSTRSHRAVSLEPQTTDCEASRIHANVKFR